MVAPILGALDPLIGRGDDLERAAGLIAQHRLLTLTGPGGSGKTRLAAALVDRIAASGIRSVFIDLSTVEPNGAIAPTILATLQLDTASPNPVDAIADAVRGEAAVLALDNLEHLPDAGDLIGSLLAATPDMRVLTTSRRALHVAGEVEFMVSPLALPEADDVASVESSAAGSLFLARARSVGRLVDVDAATAAAIAALVRRLDGLPLALELAAARSRIASPGELLARLDSHGLSTVDSASDRRRSLAAILDWTLLLLAGDERRVLDGLAVCAGFDLDLAQALVPDRDVLGLLDELVELGLVQPAGSVQGSTRFRVLETVRGEVLRRLDPTALDGHRQRHATAVLDMVAARPPAVDDSPWIERLDVEAENIRRALDQFTAKEPARALELWARLEAFWATRGRIFEGMDRFERLVERAPEPTAALAEGSGLYVSLLSGLRGNLAAAEANRRALQVARSIGDRSSEVHALDVMAINARDTGDDAVAAEVLEALDRLEPELERPMDRLYASQARYFVAGTLHGDLSDEALAALIVSTDLSVRAGRHDSSIVSLGNLALCRLWRNEPNEALGPARQATDLATEVDHRYRTWVALILAMALSGSGDRTAAIDALMRAVADVIADEASVFEADGLTATVVVAADVGRPLDAALAYGCLIHAVDAGDGELSPEDRRMAERHLQIARRGGTTLEVELAIRDGAVTKPRDLLRSIAERWAEQPSVDGPPSSPGPRLRHGELTRREVEILALVGAGQTDGQIADSLFISPKTASVHVANIKAKLGVDSRLEIALRARELGLVPGSPKGRTQA